MTFLSFQSKIVDFNRNRFARQLLKGLDLVAWLRDALKKLPTWPNSRIVKLLSFARPVEDLVTQIENDG